MESYMGITYTYTHTQNYENRWGLNEVCKAERALNFLKLMFISKLNLSALKVTVCFKQ